jgi:hypothetical protein
VKVVHAVLLPFGCIRLHGGPGTQDAVLLGRLWGRLWCKCLLLVRLARQHLRHRTYTLAAGGHQACSTMGLDSTLDG